MKRRIVYCLFIINFFPRANLFSQQISFKQITYNTDRDFISFLDITKDPLGFMWLSSFKSGIYRYDGTSFVNYIHNDTNSNSLATDYAECIYADAAGIIWIGYFNAGMDRFDPISNQFTHFRYQPGNRDGIPNDTVTAITEDHEGNLIIGTHGGLALYNKKSGKFTRYTHSGKDPLSLSDNHVRAVYVDKQGTIWAGCGSPFLEDGEGQKDGGLNRFNPIHGNFTRYMHDPDNTNSIETNKIRCLFEDSKGNFWVGSSGDGLQIMDRSKGTFTHFHYDPKNPDKLSRPPVKFITDIITFIREDNLGGIWIGTRFSGINRYDPVTGKTNHYGTQLDSAYRLVKKDISEGFTIYSTWQALFTNDGLMWITGFNGNQIFVATPDNKTIPFFPKSDKQGTPNTFYYDGDSVLWMGLDSGVVRKNLKTGTEKFYGADPKNLNCRVDGAVIGIRKDKDNHFWIATLLGGLFKLDQESNVFTRFKHDAKISSSLSSDSIFSLCLDHNDDLWIGTTNGLDKMDRKTGQFTHFYTGTIVNCIREDQDNGIWAGTNNGLFRINMKTGIITGILAKAIVISLCVDSKNTVWIGADTGRIRNNLRSQRLYHYDRVRNQVTGFIDPNSRNPISDLFDILEDDKHNLWVSTSGAIYEINEGRNEVFKFGESYGVHHNNFGTGDNFKAKNGLLFFGDGLGYYSFFPGGLKNNSQPLLHFTGFRLNGKEVVSASGGILDSPIWKTESLTLSYNQNTFSFEFIGIDYKAQGVINYLCMLDKYDETWREYGTDNKALYFNVPPGKYTFYVKAYNVNGTVSEKSIQVIISPPWWKTWWAYTLFGIICAGSFWGFMYYRSQKLRNENRLLEEKVVKRTNQLNRSIEDLKATQNQLIQSEKMASLGELTAGIAHEIQNPLNFVNNFSEVNAELIAEMKTEINQGNLKEIKSLAENIEENEIKILHHGKRADAIVKGMLQHSRASSGQKEPTDLNAIADEYLRLSYHGLRAKDKFINAAMETDFDPAVEKVNMIPQDIGRVLLNLYNNAFYAVTEKKKEQLNGYEPVVFVSTKKNENIVEIRVKDNGRGIPPKILDKIFQPFFTTKPTGSGTGLGLSLSYDIIKAHGGELKVISSEGEGATFIIQIPVI